MTTTIHLAGPLITAGTHQRQRCSWCGFVLVDDDLTRIAMPLPPCKYCGTRWSDETADQMCNFTDDGPHFFGPIKAPGGFPFEALLEVTTDGGFRATSVVEPELHQDGIAKIPLASCMELPAELTGSDR